MSQHQSNNFSHFAQRMKTAREALGLKQVDLAQEWDLTGNYISMLERGDKPVPLKLYGRIAELEARARAKLESLSPQVMNEESQYNPLSALTDDQISSLAAETLKEFGTAKGDRKRELARLFKEIGAEIYLREARSALVNEAAKDLLEKGAAALARKRFLKPKPRSGEPPPGGDSPKK